MDKPVTISDTPAIQLVEKPKSTWSGILNGAGNGAMIGGSGLLIYNIAKHLKHGEPKGKLYFAAVAATGIGTIIGGIYGLHEAKQLNTYRAALAKDIETLHAQMDGLDKTPGR